MDAASYFHHLLPEVILTLGACVVLLVKDGRSDAPRGLAPGLAFITLAAALAVSWMRGVPAEPVALPGLLMTSLTWYVRLITYGVGILLVLINWHVPEASERGEFFSILLFSFAGATLTAAANDLVVLFFAIELVSVPTYILVAISRLDGRASEAGVKYFFLGALAAALMVYGFSFLYGVAGTTTLRGASGPSLAAHFESTGAMGAYALIGMALALAGLFFKTAAVPFHAYVADVYEGAAAPVTALLGFLPKLAGFIGLVQIIGLTGWNMPSTLHGLLWAVAALSMTAGNVLALLQSSVKRTLAYSSIAHTGYMLVALLAGPGVGEGPMRDGVAALLFYIAVYGVMNLGAFAVLASLQKADGPVEDFADLRGLSVRHPLAALAMAICAFSLMGFPPTAGLLGKVYVFASAFSAADSHLLGRGMVVLAIIGVVNSAIGAAYYLRIAAACYLGAEVTETRRVGGAPMRWGLAVAAVSMLVLFAWSAPLVARSQSASAGLHAPTSARLAAVEAVNSSPGED